MKIESTIMQIYHGESQNFKMTEKERKLLDDCDIYSGIMREKLKENEELVELFEKAEQALTDLWQEISEVHYKEGFKFGLLMGIEVMSDYKSDKI